MIYYLEDDEQIRNLTIYTLSQTGKEAMGFSRAQEMYEALEHEVPDLFILDVMLPGEDGITVLQHLRSRPDTHDVPVMMLTAKSTEYDKVTGLDSGADDYMTKPFGMMELVSRINALMRRASRPISDSGGFPVQASHPRTGSSTSDSESTTSGASESTAAFGDQCEGVFDAGPIHMDVARHLVTVNGMELRLTRKEFDMLHYLMVNRGIVVSRSQLLDHVWGYSVAGHTRTVDAHVQTLRKKLGEIDPSASSMVETVRGVGYRVRE